jgi:soluble lytic murein transglycosylase-like protein
VSLENLQSTLQRIQEIKSRFEPAASRVDSGANGTADFDLALNEALGQRDLGGASPVPGALQGLIENQADRFGLDADLLKAVIRTESNFNPAAVSKAGARGLMQLMPGTARELGVLDSFDPAQNVAGGAKYLKNLMSRYGQDLPKALAAYNAGPGAVDRFGGIPPYAETTQYVKKVLQSYRAYQGGLES